MAKTVFTNDELAHIWASITQDEGRNSSRSYYFRGPVGEVLDSVLYSYAQQIARITRVAAWASAPVVLHHSDSWSQTTNRHQSRAKDATRHLMSFTVPYLFVQHVTEGENFREVSSSGHLLNLKHYADKITTTEARAAKARKANMVELWNEIADETRVERANYCRVFGITDEEVTNLEALQARLDAARREREAARDAAYRVSLAERKERWEAGALGVSVSDWPEVLLRAVVASGVDGSCQDVETSKGARVPMHEARALYFGVKNPGLWDALRGTRVGHYTIDDISEETQTLSIGCHVLTFAEVERFASSQGWGQEVAAA